MQRASRYQRRLAKEQGAGSVYRALVQRREGEEREILLALARAEERHAAHWAAKLHPSERRPILPFLITSGTAALAAAAVVVGVALFATGTTVGLLTGGPLLRRGLRQLGIGVAAALVTYGLGRVFGTTIG